MVFKFIIKRHDDPPAAPPLEERVFDEQIVTIGSDPAATVRFESPDVAPEQALVILEESAPLLINRAAGTLLNGEPLAREIRRPLAHGDRLSIGDRQIIVDLGARARDANSTNGAGAHAYAAARERDGEPKSFASILDDLRTEEDSFYFRVETAAGGEARIVIENSETIVGWDASGASVVADARQVAIERMIVRKDWTGVLVEPRGGSGALQVNGSAVSDTRRLRDGDRLTLAAPIEIERAGADRAASAGVLVFHEPASLIALETLLPQRLPPPVAATPATPMLDSAERSAGDAARAPVRTGARLARLPKRYLGYFTATELVIMAVATVIAAAIIFLVLEYS